MTVEVVKKHGMGTDLVDATWEIFSVAIVKDLLAYYPQFKEAQKIEWHSPRPFSSAAIVMIDGKRYFVKRHAAVIRDVEGLLEEHRIIAHLRTKGIPVSKIVEGQFNITAFCLNDWTYEIHEIGEGVDLYRDAISWSPFASNFHAYAAGEMLAKVHQATASYLGGKRKIQPLVSTFDIFMSDDPIAAVEQFMIGRPGLEQYLQKRQWKSDFATYLIPFYARFKQYKQALKPLWTHNDWHASNLLWTNQTLEACVATVLDFGLSNETNAVYDIATALERNVVQWLDIDDETKSVIHAEAAIAFLQGYQSIELLTEQEKHALVNMLPIVHTDFALSEVDYFMRITQSEIDADEAYDTFLIGHAKWFNSLQGQQLLQAIQKELDI